MKSLNAKRDTEIDSFKLKYYARIAHFIIDSYGSLKEDNREKKYHGELRHAICRHIRGQTGGDEFKAHYLCEMAWETYADDKLVDEALILIDSAICLHPDCPAEYYNRKAIILDGGLQYDEALEWYDRAISKKKSK